MAIIAGLSEKKVSYNSVKMTQKSYSYGCYGTEPGFGPGLVAMATNRDHFKATETASH